MKKCRGRLTRTFGDLVWVILLCVSARAGQQVFYLDQTQSVISAAGNLGGAALQEQGMGSLTSHFAGTINVDAEVGTLQFTGGSVMDAQVNGNWQPRTGGATGVGPADYGAKFTTGFVQAFASLRNVRLDVISGIVPTANGSFDSSLLTFYFPTNWNSTADYRAAGGVSFGTVTLSGLSTNHVTSLATLTSTGTVDQLTIPVNAQYGVTIAGLSGQVSLAGQIVATRTNTTPVGFSIGSIGITNQVLTLQWDSTPGVLYWIEGTPDFNGWSVVASNIIGTGATQTFATNVSGQSGFYRMAH